MSTPIPRLNIPLTELRSLVLEGLKNSNGSFDFKNFCNSIGSLAVSKEIVQNPNPQGFQTMYFPLQKEDENRVREIIWNLIIEQVLTIGGYNENTWPHLSVTDYGKSVLSSQLPVPHDPDGYLSRIKREIPDLDSVIEIYLIEAIRTYNINQLLSSTITLGCASEKALLVLIDTFIDTFNQEEPSSAFAKKVRGRFIKIQFDEFNKTFSRHLGELPSDLRDRYTNTLLGVFEMIRQNRNSAGHPTGKSIDKETLFANLQVFIIYCKYIYELKAYLEQHKHD